MSEDHVREIIQEEVIEIIRGQILEMIGSFKTAMVQYFVEHHAAIAKTATAAASTSIRMARRGAGRAFQYRDLLLVHILMSRGL